MNETRNREMVRMHVEDRMTFSEIGKVVGLSRERVRWLMRREGVPQSVTADVKARALRHKRVPRTSRICECGGTFDTLPSQRTRLFCSHRCYSDSISYSDTNLIQHLQKLAALLGRTPNQSDVNSADGPYHVTYVRHFGTWHNAQVVAGLKPNELGRAGHVRIAPRVEGSGA